MEKMKKVTNPFGAVVELKQLGFSVVSARVVLPGNICLYDVRRLSGSIMEHLVADASIVVHPLDDGSFILCKAVAATASRELTLASCVRQEPKSVCFHIGISLEDAEVHDVMIDLAHRFDCRRDYFVNHCRVIDLRGTISVEVEGKDDETLEA